MFTQGRAELALAIWQASVSFLTCARGLSVYGVFPFDERRRAGSLSIWIARKLGVQCGKVQLAFPAGNRQGSDAISDHVREGAGF